MLIKVKQRKANSVYNWPFAKDCFIIYFIIQPIGTQYFQGRVFDWLINKTEELNCLQNASLWTTKKRWKFSIKLLIKTKTSNLSDMSLSMGRDIWHFTLTLVPMLPIPKLRGNKKNFGTVMTYQKFEFDVLFGMLEVNCKKFCCIWFAGKL